MQLLKLLKMKNYIKIFTYIMIFSLFSFAKANQSSSAFDFTFKSINEGEIIDLNKYNNKVLLVVNVASRCGYTNQYSDLQKLWENYKNDGLVVIGVPSNNFKQEPGSNNEIKDFCEVNFNITFPMTEKLTILGSNAHPFFIWAKESYGISAIPKWNFHKILVGKNGKIINTYSSFTNPNSKKMRNAIEKEIKS